ncbi:MAG: hypothetical protein HPY83_05200 [Anaerolineae bacterium]|nr:hypothetical protein [Anaerolineae bacterium]
MSECPLVSGLFSVEVEAGRRSLRLTSPSWPEMALEGLAPALVVDRAPLQPTDLSASPGPEPLLRWSFAQAGLALEQRLLPGQAGLRVESRLCNLRAAERILNHVALLATPEAHLGNQDWATRILIEGGYRAYVTTIAEALGTQTEAEGEAGFQPGQSERPAVERAIVSQMFSVICGPGEGRALLAGFDSFRRWLGQVTYALDHGRLRWTLGFDGGDLLVLPKEDLELESFVLTTGPDAWVLLEHFVTEVAQRNNITALDRPPVTWCSWYPYRLGVSEERVLATADVAAQRLLPLGLTALLVDLGWQQDYLPASIRENDQFPHRFAWLSQRLAERRLKLGCWLAPYTVSEFDPVYHRHPEWLLSDGQGRPKALGTWFWTPHGNTYALDLTHPAAQDHLKHMVESLAERGVRYLKNDFLGGASSPQARGRHNPRMVAGGGIEAARLGSQIITGTMREADPEALVLSGNPHEPAGLGYYNLLYTCMDTGNSGFVGWRHLREVYTTTAIHTVKNGRWGIIQPSCLVVGPPGTLEEARLRATATFLAGGQVDIGDDLTTLPEERWQVLTATLPPLGRSARPVDLFHPVEVLSVDYEGLSSGRRGGAEAAPPKVGPRVWHLPLEHEGDRWHLMALFEYDPPERDRSGRSDLITWFRVPMQRLGLDPNGRYWVYEFWGAQFLGHLPRLRLPAAYAHPGDAAALLLPGDPGLLEVAFFGPAVKLLVIREAREYPWPVGTTFHQSGGTELSGITWDEGARTLSGRVMRPAGQHGSITLAGALPGEPAITVSGRAVPWRRTVHGSLTFDVITEGDVTPWEVHW